MKYKKTVSKKRYFHISHKLFHIKKREKCRFDKYTVENYCEIVENQTHTSVADKL